VTATFISRFCPDASAVSVCVCVCVCDRHTEQTSHPFISFYNNLSAIDANTHTPTSHTERRRLYPALVEVGWLSVCVVSVYRYLFYEQTHTINVSRESFIAQIVVHIPSTLIISHLVLQNRYLLYRFQQC